MEKRVIYLGADHAGFKLKEKIKKYFDRVGIEYDDLGGQGEKGDDYPDYAFAVAEKVAKIGKAVGILICGTGTGMVIAANKVEGIRAAVGYDSYSAKMSREHNDANVLCLRGRRFSDSENLKIVKIWLNSRFSGAERHKRRLRKEKMKIQAEIRDVMELSKKETVLMNKWRGKEFGRNEVKNFKRDYPLKTKFFFVKDGGKIVAFGGLMPVSINYLGKQYKVLGICNIISIKKGKGYGRALIKSMIRYLKKIGKTGLGFTSKTDFFKKAGLKTRKDFIKRFIYKNPETGKEIVDNDGDGIYYEGKDKFVSRILSTKSVTYINVLHW